MQNEFPIHVRTVTGLEEVLAEELRSLGAREVDTRKRVVFCQGDKELLYKLNLWCRTAIRVLRPLISFHAEEERDLYQGVQRVKWSQWLRENGKLAVDADISTSFCTHSLYVSQLVKDAIVDQFRKTTGTRPSVDLRSPDLKIAVTVFKNEVQIYLDSSGESLHKRGYRQEAGTAPLNEALAAGILLLSGWDGTKPLLDPMCGSGTLAIEAGLIAGSVAPGLLRSFGFQKWPDYDRALFEKLVLQAKSAISKNVSGNIRCFDSDRKLVEMANANIQRAGLSNMMQARQGNFFEWFDSDELPGVLMMNPPYDERLALGDAVGFYRRIGDTLKQHYPGWTAFILTGNAECAKNIGLKSSRRFVLFNGAMESRLLKFEMRSEKPKSPGPWWRFKDTSPKLVPQSSTAMNLLD